MPAEKDLFLSLVTKVQQSGLQKQILETEANRYQIPPFRSEKMDYATIKNLYSALEYKYTESKELPEDPEGWNDNEKKLFIWIIIFYVYFLEKEGRVLAPSDWDSLSRMLFLKNPQFLRFQYLNLVKPQGKITWSPEEDNILNEAVEAMEKGKWYQISRYIFVNSSYTVFKSPKHCRERWLNHLDDHKKRGNWSPEQDLKIFKFVAENGKRWCKLVPVLEETRTEHMIKNRYNSLLNKQKMKKKETEDHLITKIIRQLKKQIANIEKRKLKKEQKMLQQSFLKQEASDHHQNIQKLIKNEELGIQNQQQFKENYELQDDKVIQTPVSVDAFLKKEAHEGSESDKNQKEETDPVAKSSSELPFYTPQQNIQDYPFLLEQQMHMVHYFYAYYPPR